LFYYIVKYIIILYIKSILLYYIWNLLYYIILYCIIWYHILLLFHYIILYFTIVVNIYSSIWYCFVLHDIICYYLVLLFIIIIIIIVHYLLYIIFCILYWYTGIILHKLCFVHCQFGSLPRSRGWFPKCSSPDHFYCQILLQVRRFS